MPSLSKIKVNKVSTAPHVIVKALAGTGKTTTLVEGLKELKEDWACTACAGSGIPSKNDVAQGYDYCSICDGAGETPRLTPSPQQQAVWDAILQSQNDANTICFVAFNKSIASELQARVPAGCEAMTMHSLGLKAVTNAYGKLKISGYRVQDMISKYLKRDIKDIRKKNATALRATQRLVSLCKLTLTKPTIQNLDAIASHHDIDLNGSRDTIFDMVPTILEWCKNPTEDRQIDFDDMIWLPVINELSMTKYDLLLGDESQDFNRCQQELFKKSGTRYVLVGDENQAIYGWAGADSDSIGRFEEELLDTEVGVEVYPLTQTRRCGQAIVKEAQQFVPGFEAHESNLEGSITSQPLSNYRKFAEGNDMVLSRVNAPLVRECFRFIKDGKKANIRGRDIGQGLISTIKKLKSENIEQLSADLSNWIDKETTKENAKKNPNENKLIALEDRYECLCQFIDDSGSIEEVINKIETLFSDKDVPGILLSSIHKAKGLEASRVFFLRTKEAPVPHPMAKTNSAKAQENNLVYVAVTRAINELIYVVD